MKYVFILFLTFSNYSYAQVSKFEEIALLHFFDNEFTTRYPNIKDIQFNGLTSDELTNIIDFKNCLELDDEILSGLDRQAYGHKFAPKEVFTVPSIGEIQIRKKKTKSRYKLFVFQVNEFGGHAYVIIGVTKTHYFSDWYYFEMDLDGSILNWCKSGMVH
jgi:hypothetical protein